MGFRVKSMFDMHYFFIVRYSILMLKQRSGWLLRRLDDHKYRRSLFDPARLALHERLFFGVTLPSVRKQLAHVDESNLRLIVLTSTELPNPWKERLLKVLQPYGWAQVLEIPPEAKHPFSTIPDVIRERCNSERYVTARLDDDDGLSADFLQQIRNHVDRTQGSFGISLASGYLGLFDGHGFEEYREHHRPMNAVGLATVHARSDLDSTASRCKHVFQGGRHTQLDRKLPTIVDGARPAYLRVIHAGSDRFRQLRKRSAKSEPVDEEEVIRCLGFSPVFD